jgi:hypothetical protein
VARRYLQPGGAGAAPAPQADGGAASMVGAPLLRCGLRPGSGWLTPDRRTYANRQPKVVTQPVIQPAWPIGRDQTVIRGAAARETRKMERATRSAVSAAAFLQALDAFAAHLAEARIAEPRAFGLLAPAPPWCEPRSSPAPSRRARHRCARGSTIRCLGIEVVAASSNSSRQTLARKG